jgi:hypothetical protein
VNPHPASALTLEAQHWETCPRCAVMLIEATRRLFELMAGWRS